MTSARVTRSVGTLGVLLLLCACAQRGVGGSLAPTDPGLPTGPDALVLQVEHTGGFVTPETLVGRLPIVSVYADGRVLTEGPVIAIHPGPAWPNVQVQEIDPSGVRTLVEHARAAGVDETGDLGTPPLADVPSTRFTLVTAAGTSVREVYALSEAEGLDDGGPGALPGGSGLTEEQLAARAELRGLLDELTDLGRTPAVSYEPTAVAALVRPWTTTSGDPAGPAADPVQPEVRWPGPPLPGEPVGPLPDLSCVTATGEQAVALRAAAQQANQLTPWVTDDGGRWAVTFRPLLPHESGCADLTG